MTVGSILAAFGTALPESVVTLVAVTTGSTAEAMDIGVGAAMGGPPALATVACGVTGAMLLLKCRRERTAVLATTGMRPQPRSPTPMPRMVRVRRRTSSGWPRTKSGSCRSLS